MLVMASFLVSPRERTNQSYNIIEEPGATDELDYLAMCSGGNGADFGNLASNHRYLAGASSSTRSLFGAGSTPSSSNVIQYVEIMTTGNAIDFGDMMGNGSINSGSWQTPVNAFFVDAALSTEQEIQVVKIASKGNTVSWGNRGLQSGDMSRAHPYETDFLKSVLTKDKIIDRFRKYFGGKKAMNNRTARKRR